MSIKLPTKELIIAIIEKDNSILMRQKPEGSAPYKETWYSFGCDRIFNQDDSITIKNYLKDSVGIDVQANKAHTPVTGEVKKDHDGQEKEFIYINFLCKYLGGNPEIPDGAERIAWIPKDQVKNYDLVPPVVELFKSLGYLN